MAALTGYCFLFPPSTSASAWAEKDVYLGIPETRMIENDCAIDFWNSGQHAVGCIRIREVTKVGATSGVVWHSWGHYG